MPQFEFSSTLLWSQTLWLAFFFAILYFGIVRLTLPKLGRVMTAREDQVNGDLETAARSKAEADRMVAAHEAEVAEAQTTARARLAEAQASAAREIEAKLAASKAVLDTRAAEAHATLEAARTHAMGEIEAVVAEAAADIVEKLTGDRPASTEVTTATRTAMA